MSEHRLTVLQILPALNTGGVERETLQLAAELVRRGHRSLVVSQQGRLVEQLAGQGSEHVAWPVGRKSPLALRWVPRLQRLLRDEQVDILHAHSRVPAWLAWLAWRRLPPQSRPRFITTVHGLHSVNRFSAIMTRGERVIAVSQTIRQYVLDNYPSCPPERIRVIPGGIDPDEFPYGYRPGQAWQRQWYGQAGCLSQGPVITLPGRLTRLKGHADFLELLAHLRQRGLRPVGLIVGDTDYRRAYTDELRRLAGRRNLDRLLFLGHRNDIREVYAMSDLVLSLSRRPEAFGLTVLEALALGVPVVGYDHGGVGEVLGTLFPQGTVPPGNLQRLADKVAQLLATRPIVPPCGQFTLDKMLEATLALYHSLAAERGGRGPGVAASDARQERQPCKNRLCA